MRTVEVNSNAGLPLRPQLPSHALFQKRGENIIFRLRNARDTAAVWRGCEEEEEVERELAEGGDAAAGGEDGRH